jgi:hypothetical protein
MIRAFAAHGTVTRAAKEIRMDRRNHSRWMNADPDYREQFNQAKRIYTERLEAECDRRAVEGVVRQQFYKGQPIVLPCDPDEPGAVEIVGADGKKAWVRPYFEREYSDNLLMFRLKRLDPAYRDQIEIRAKTQSTTSAAGPLNRTSLYAALRERLVAQPTPKTTAKPKPMTRAKPKAKSR